MKQAKVTLDNSKKQKPARTQEGRENQMIALATDLAEKQLREGTASSQVITHYLKLGSTRERLEKEIKIEEMKLLQAKTQSIKEQNDMKELMEEALKAFKGYSGHGDEEDYE